ncbi:hypothetical protein [Dyadobacter sp. 676]|uniref:Lipoprotein n=1 Tax=Dyadobacter sp. 676 TaxID=3088362 RepID=A0AAU8FBQ0_9BACT
MKCDLRTFFALCLLVVGLHACTMQDHVAPRKIKLSTPEFEYTDDFKMRFKIQVDSLGDLPVTEYGILHLSFFRAQNDTDYTPRIEHGARMQFDQPVALGVNSYVYTGNAFQGKYFFFYRAYALLSDGSVSYGDIKSFTFGP